MDFKKVQEYFEDIVKRFPPFKDSRFFQALIDYLKDYYLREQYEENPQVMKNLYENNRLVDSVYDQFLASLGVYENVIRDLTSNEKQIFLNSLSDFFKYKSSVDFFQKVAQFFPDRFDIYELFIDYDKDNEKWILKPFEIYRDPVSGGFEENLDYENTYNQVPSLLVAPEQLTSFYNNENIILPLKSNLILLSYSFVDELDDLNNLAISTFLKEKGSDLVTIYFKDQSFNASINNINKIWHYLTWRLNNPSSSWGISYIKSSLHFDSLTNPYSLEDIDQIFSDINLLETTSEIHNYFEQNIVNTFLTTFKTKKQSISNFKDLLESENYELMEYLDNRISGLSNENLKLEINEILRELYNSLIMHRFGLNDSEDDRLTNKYFELFISSLPQIVLDVDNTGSYKILYNFKPYHAEIVTQSFTMLKSESNLNKVVPNDSTYDMLLKLVKADYASVLVDYNSFLISLKINSSFSIYEGKSIIFNLIKNNNYDLNESFLKKIEQIKACALQISDLCDPEFKKIFYGSEVILERNNFLISAINYLNYQLDDYISNLILNKSIIIYSINDYKFGGKFLKEENENINILSKFFFKNYALNYYDYELSDLVYPIVILKNNMPITISLISLFNYNIKKHEQFNLNNNFSFNFEELNNINHQLDDQILFNFSLYDNNIYNLDDYTTFENKKNIKEEGIDISDSFEILN